MAINKTITFEGTIGDFRALMSWIGRELRWPWPGPECVQNLVCYDADETSNRAPHPCRSTWTVSANPFGSAAIDATEERPGQVRIEFRDGGSSPAVSGLLPLTPIGPLFEQFCRVVTGEIELVHGVTTAGGDIKKPSLSLPAWFPKKAKTKSRWRQAYQVTVKIREEYRDLYYADHNRDSPDPQIDDLREALLDSPLCTKRPSARTVKRIVDAGENGWLEGT